jgi:hypothetical protein
MKVDLRIQRLYVRVPIKIVTSNHFYFKDLCQLCNKTMLNPAAMLVSEAGNVKMRCKIFSIYTLRPLLQSLISSRDSSYWFMRTASKLSGGLSKALATLLIATYTNTLAPYTYATGRTEHGLSSL